MLYCGIDLGFRPKTSLALVSFNKGMFILEHNEIGLTDERIEKIVWDKRPDVVAIDAPLSASQEKIRPADKELRELLKQHPHSKIFSPEGNIASPFGRTLFSITYRGKYLLQRLQNITNVIETHPLINFLFLEKCSLEDANRLKNRKEDCSIQREILLRYFKSLPKNLEDHDYDAIISAMLACVYSKNESKNKFKILELPKLYNTDASFVVFKGNN